MAGAELLNVDDEVALVAGQVILARGLVSEILPEGRVTVSVDDAVDTRAKIVLRLVREDGLYEGPAVVLRSWEPVASEARARMLMLEVGEVVRVQRREFVRCDEFEYPVRFAIVRVPADLHREPVQRQRLFARWRRDRDAKPLKGQARDMSAGGLRMLTSFPLQRDTHLFLTIAHPDLTMDLAGEVVWVGGDVHGQRLVGVRFLAITETERAALTQYVFQQQLHRRRMRKER